jgi:pimeloyl-ACP methyl ester carboxylesterase
MLVTESIIYGDQKNLRIARLGNSSIPLILLHGYPDSLQIWSLVAPLLSDSIGVIAIDWPGLGGSSPTHGEATPTAMAQRLLEVLNVLGIEKCSLCGFDMGGQPALAFAAKYPERIQKLIIMNSLVFGALETSWEISVLRQFKLNSLILRHLPSIVFWRARMTSLYSAVPDQKAIFGDFWKYFKRREVREFLIKMCAGYQGQLHYLATLYPSIRAPTLVMWSEHDKHFPLSQGLQLSREIEGASLFLLKNCAHWAPLAAPDNVASAINTFLGLK